MITCLDCRLEVDNETTMPKKKGNRKIQICGRCGSDKLFFEPSGVSINPAAHENINWNEHNDMPVLEFEEAETTCDDCGNSYPVSNSHCPNAECTGKKTPEIPKAPSIPSPSLRMKNNDGIRYHQYIDIGWTEQQLVDKGLAEWVKDIPSLENFSPEPHPLDSIKAMEPDAKYLKQIFPIVKTMHFVDEPSIDEYFVDVYRVLDAFPTGSAALDHAIKKLLVPGGRGTKDYIQDLNEAIRSIQQAINLELEKEAVR